MSIFSKSTFVFGPEPGARLKALRKRRGLTLRDVAVLMDRHGTGSHNANAARRQGALDRIERRATESGFSKEATATLLEVATQSYNHLLLSDRLDWEPTQLEIISRRGLAPKVQKAEARLDMEEVKPVSEQNKTEGLIRAMVFTAVNARLDEQKLDFYSVKRHYNTMIDRLLDIAFAHGADSPEWKAEVNATAPRLHDETFARAMAALAAETLNLWAKRLPSKQTQGT